jgi:hypothetical protein
MKHIRTILVALAAVSLVGVTGCPEDDPSDPNDNGDEMDVATDTEQPDPDVSEDTEQPDDVAPDSDEMEDVQQDTPPASGDPIPSIHDGTISTGSSADLDNVLVTAVGDGNVSGENGFAVQEPSSKCTAADGGCGIWVEAGDGFSNYPSRGDNISFEGTVEQNFGLLEVVSPTNITVNSSGNTLPDPVVVDPSVVWTNGSDTARAESLRGTLVQVENVTTVNTNPDNYPGMDSEPCNSDFNEWAVWAQGDTGNVPTTTLGSPQDCPASGDETVDTGLRIDDWFFPDSGEGSNPSPDTEVDYDSITGIFLYAFGNNKIGPRNASDIVEAGGGS